MARRKAAETVNTEVEAIAEKAEEVKEEAPKIETPEKKTRESSKDKEIANLKAELEQLKELLKEQSNQQKTVYVTSENTERVWFLWLADVSDENNILIGDHGQYGRIIGKTGSFYVPKKDLSRILDTAFRYYLQHRWMIVISGLTDEEREALGVNYKEGELLDERMFRKIAEMKRAEMLEIFPELCEEHKKIVASRLHEAYENGKQLDRQLIIELNKIYPNVALKDIIERMNAKDLGEE